MYLLTNKLTWTWIRLYYTVVNRWTKFVISFAELGLGTHLFVKVPRPGDSEVTFSVFESNSTLGR